MNCDGLEIETSLGTFTVYRDGNMNCHHFHSEANFSQSEQISVDNYRLSLWMCDLIETKIGEEIIGRLKNGNRYNMGQLVSRNLK